MNILNDPYINLNETAKSKKREYMNNKPFPHIVFDNFFNPVFLKKVLAEFPDLPQLKRQITYKNPNELKTASVGAYDFGVATRELLNFINAEPFLEFIQKLTGITEPLIPDPYFEGAGYHQVNKGGFLKVHADFNKHVKTGLDRRLNLIVYMNENWEDSFGGHLELWDKQMLNCEQKVSPNFNTVLLFTTTDFTYHGLPEPLNCPEGFTRKSLAVFYYSNGRPHSEIDINRKDHPALFLARKTSKSDNKMKVYNSVINFFINELAPPVLSRSLKRLVIHLQKKS